MRPGRPSPASSHQILPKEILRKSPDVAIVRLDLIEQSLMQVKRERKNLQFAAAYRSAPEKPAQPALEAANAATPYIQPRLTTIDTTIRGGASYIDDLKAIAVFQNAVSEARAKAFTHATKNPGEPGSV